MIDVQEHVYHDDPQIGPPDVRTQLQDVCYFFLGNGLISVAIQHAPAGEGSLYGLLVTDPEALKAKREALSFDSKTGLANTMLRITLEGQTSPLIIGGLTVAWDFGDRFPRVRVAWRGPSLEISELFYCPDHATPTLVREIRLQNDSQAPISCRVETGLPSEIITRPMQLNPQQKTTVLIIYSLQENYPRLRCEFSDLAPSSDESRLFGAGAAQVCFGSPVTDHLFQTAAAQLPAVVSRTGKVDAGIWQYNREWVRDQSILAHALVMCGRHEIAGVILNRLLRKFVSGEGSTVDSSEVRSPADAELDQNGALLHAVRAYTLWTGDLSIARSNWDRIVQTAEFPLQPIFRETNSGLLANQRDFWERHRVYGIEPGIELAHQVYVSVGLESAAALARQMGRHSEAERWRSEAVRLKTAILFHPTYCLVNRQGFIKRRNLDGTLQEFIQPHQDSGLPPEVGLARNIPHPLHPDSSCALPIVLGFVPGDSAIARATLEQLETLWNQGWETGGYGRYHMDSDPDSPGPWPFPSIYIARAAVQHRAPEKAWRVLNWLASLPQYPSGAYFEMYGKRIAPPYAQNGIVPWNWAEMVLLVIENILGFRPEEDAIRIGPRLLPGMMRAKGSLPFRGHRIYFSFSTNERIPKPQFRVAGRPVPSDVDGVRLPFHENDIHIEGTLPGESQRPQK
jgi:hypothetical protein